MRQPQTDGKLQPGVHGAQCVWEEAADAVLAMSSKWTTTTKLAKDSVTGQPLPEELVKAGRKLEFEYFWKKCVWTKVHRSEAFSRTGKAQISVRWIDTNKGDGGAQNIRCRFVPHEIRKAGEDQIFAPIPHWRA